MSVEETTNASLEGRHVEFDENYTIHSDKHLPELDSPSSQAFFTQDIKAKKSNIFALISKRRLPPRLDVLTAMRNLIYPIIMKPVNWGVVDWPPANRRVFLALFEQPAGGKHMESLTARVQPQRDETLIDNFIAPLVGVIKEYSARGLVHRAIRPDNIYFSDTDRTQILLGEGFMNPPGINQPVMFETIENGMCHPSGRSMGTIVDDLYALGVTILFLYLGRAPITKAENDDDLIVDKIERGSYAALAGRERVSRSIKEVLRGLLADDSSERWTLEELNLWLDGRRVSPQQPTVPHRGARPVTVGGKSYFTCRSLAHGLFSNWSEADTVIKETDLENWAHRTVGDVGMSVAISTILARGSFAEGSSNPEMLISWLIMTLDPDGPIRYRNFAAHIDGFGGFLAHSYKEENGPKLFADVISSDLPSMWITAHFGDGVEANPLLRAIDRLRAILSQTAFGQGIERCLYDLNPTLPCVSPLVEKYYVEEAEDLLPALELAAQETQNRSLPMDRHIAAFIAARFEREVESHLRDLSNRDDPAQVVLSTLRVLAVMQWRMGPRKLPALTEWIAQLLGPVVERYNSLPMRQMILAQITQSLGKGSLVEILNMVDDPRRRRQDEVKYRNAVIEYAAAESELVKLNETVRTQGRDSHHSGHRTSAAVSLVLAILIIVSFQFLM